MNGRWSNSGGRDLEKGEEDKSPYFTYVNTRRTASRHSRQQSNFFGRSGILGDIRSNACNRAENKRYTRRDCVFSPSLFAKRTPTSSLTLAHTAGKTRGKCVFTTGSMNISGVLTSRAGSKRVGRGRSEWERKGEIARVCLRLASRREKEKTRAGRTWIKGRKERERER